MKRIITIIVISLSMTVMTNSLFAQNVIINNGNVNLDISSATAGSEPDSDTDVSTQLEWSGGGSTHKITVMTNIATPNFTLKVEAVNVAAGNGTSAGEVTLSVTPTDFIVNIGNPSTRQCDLQYVATALASDGTGVDTHTITYTIVVQ